MSEPLRPAPSNSPASLWDYSAPATHASSPQPDLQSTLQPAESSCCGSIGDCLSSIGKTIAWAFWQVVAWVRCLFCCPADSPSPLPVVFVPGQPAGLERAGNNCWANALGQLCTAFPSYGNGVSHIGAFAAFINQYREALEQSQVVAKQANSQNLREALHAKNADAIAKNCWRQEDCGEALMLAMESANNRAAQTLIQGILPQTPFFVLEKQNIRHGGAVEQLPPEPGFLLPVTLRGHRNLSFEQLVRRSLIATNPEFVQKRRFHTAPEEILFQMNRFMNRGDITYKITDPIEAIPATYRLSDISVTDGQGANYDCDFIIEHVGQTPRSGHYISYRKVGATWWCMDDASVKPITEEEARSARSRAYLVHYSRIPLILGHSQASLLVFKFFIDEE